MKRILVAISLWGALGATLASVASAQTIESTDDYPVRGAPTEIVVTLDPGVAASGATIRATYRPNSQTSVSELLEADASGRVEWTPTAAGIVQLDLVDPSDDTATLASTNVAVRFDRTPTTGVTVMVLAGLLLFGGAALAMWALLRSGRTVEDPPST